jgi:archaellum biogenesis ATPase FlaH
MLYCEIAKGTFQNRAIVIPESTLGKYKKELRPGEELYRSLYSYGKEIEEHMLVRQTVKTYDGLRYIPGKLLFDIDRRQDTYTTTAERVFEFYRHLTEEWDIPANAINIFFSGRGFHVTIPDVFNFEPRRNLHLIVSATLMKNFGTYVNDDIYKNATRLIRVNGTVNLRSNLFKVCINPNWLVTHSEGQMQELARTNQQFPLSTTDEELPDYRDRIEVVREYRNWRGLHVPEESVSQRSTQYVTCMQKLYAQGPVQGQRHDSVLRLASSFRRGGVPEEATAALLISWCPTLEPYEIKKTVHGIYANDLKYGCADKIMSAYCDTKCMYYTKKNFIYETPSAEEVEKRFSKYVKEDHVTAVFDLADMYSIPEEYKFYPGEVAIVWGDTGVGKSAWVQNIITNIEQKTLFMTLEMSVELAYRRFVQIKQGMTKDEVYSHYTTGENTYSEAIRHLHITPFSPRIEAINKLIADSGCKVIVIDTIDAIPTSVDDENSRVGQIAIALKQVAQQRKCIIIGIHHISKFAALEENLTLHSGKGSSSIEQKADKVIGIQRYGEYGRKVFALKSRDESNFNLFYRFDPKTFRFTQVESPDKILEVE